jgi:hypothetical protein
MQEREEIIPTMETAIDKLFSGVVVLCFGFMLFIIDWVDIPVHMKLTLSLFPTVGIITIFYSLLKTVLRR